MEAQLRELIKQKDEMEKEIATLGSQIELLEQTQNLHKNLTDSEGFPRADIDFGQLANYRSLKKRRAELNNDHYALMKVIQKKLFELHASYPQSNANTISETHESKNTPMMFKKDKKEGEMLDEKEVSKSSIDYLTPFAKLSIVFEGSPAEKAGTKVGDLLSELGEINIYSLDWQKQIAGIVQQTVALRVVILRQIQSETKTENRVFELKDGNSYEKIELELIPGRWDGRGLLGCKIDPLS